MPSKFVQNVLFCDDVRTEQSGKDIAIGIYNGYIVLPQIPFVINLAVRVEANLSGNVKHGISAKFRDPMGNDLAESYSPIELFDWDLPFGITLGFANLILPTPGEYKLLVKFDDEWEEYRTLNVQKINPAQIGERLEILAKRFQSEGTSRD
jgi:hypothetical protein